jgi:hypothetical protein
MDTLKSVLFKLDKIFIKSVSKYCSETWALCDGYKNTVLGLGYWAKCIRIQQ